MSEQMKIRTWVDGQFVEKMITVPRTTSAERRKAVTQYGWMVQTVDTNNRMHRTPTMFSATPPQNWLEAITSDPDIKRYRLYKSGKIIVQGVKA